MTLRQIIEHASFAEVTRIDLEDEGGSFVSTGHGVDILYDRTTQKAVDCLVVYCDSDGFSFPLDQEIVWEKNKVKAISRYKFPHTLSFSKQTNFGEDKFV